MSRFDVTNHYAEDTQPDFYSPWKPSTPYGPPPSVMICIRCILSVPAVGTLDDQRQAATANSGEHDCIWAECQCACN